MIPPDKMSHAPLAGPPAWSSPGGAGWIEVICGSMFSGKTQELIRRLRLAAIARQKVQVFNSALDVRYGRNHLISHDQARIPSKAVRSGRQVIEAVDWDTQVVGIDEIHFFEPDLVSACEALADAGKRVIAAGLDQDYRGRPFAVTAKLMAVAEFVTKNMAVCVVCGAPANKSRRISASTRRIVIGAKDAYEARCRRCFAL